MRKEQKDIAGLGPIEILCECLKVYRANSKVFFLIQLTFMLPVAIMALGLNYHVLSKLPVPPNLNSRSSTRPQLEPFLILFDPALLQLDPLLVLLATNAFLMALSLAQTTSLGLHYAVQPIPYLDVLRAATPRLWMHRAVTNTWASVMALFLDLVGTLSALILTPAKLPFGFSLGQWVAFAVTVVGDCRTVIFTITPGVSVLQEDYGWAAVRKSRKLLKETMTVAQFFFMVMFGVLMGWSVVSEMKEGYFSAWTGAQLGLITVVYLAWTIFVWQVDFLCSGVQYVSFKAYHDESLADPPFQNIYERLICSCWGREQDGPPRWEADRHLGVARA